MKPTNRAMIEPLEQRALLAGNYIVSFYGLGGGGSFGSDWMDKAVDTAAAETGSTVRRYNEDQGGAALKDFFRAVDRNHNKRIDKREVASVSLRVIGYSLGGVSAANFARYLLKLGQTIKGYLINAGTPVRALVALDPVNDVPGKQTEGVPNNVQYFTNYYQQKGGDTTIDLYTRPLGIKVDSITVEDPLNIKGDTLNTNARRSSQVRVDVGDLADETVKHKVRDNLDGKLKGRNVNHGTLPFFAYDFAVRDLTK